MSRYDYYSQRNVSPLGKWINGTLYRSIEAYVHSGPVNTLLEIGPGAGEATRILKDSVENYYVKEPNEALQDSMRKLGVEVLTGYAPPIELEDSSVDAILLIHVLEHVPNLESAEKLIAEIKRVLKPGGRFLVVAPDIVDVQGYFYEYDYTHQFPTSLYRVNSLLEDQGLVVTNKKFLYGGDTGFLGRLANLAIKSFYSLFSFVLDGLYERNRKILKMRMLFSRSIWLEVTKRADESSS